MTEAPQTYHPAQKILHWVVVLGILAQWVLNEPMVRVIDALQTGGTPIDSDMTMALVHVTIGSTIFFAVLARLFLRLRHGVPDHAPGTSPVQAQIATWMHRALYATLFAMVITGGMTWNGVAQLGDLHFYFNILLFVLALAHAAAAVFNQFVRKDGTLRRMM